MSLKKGDNVIIMGLGGVTDKPGIVVNPVPNVFGCIEVDMLVRVSSAGSELRQILKVYHDRVVKSRIRRLSGPITELQKEALRGLVVTPDNGVLYVDVVKRAIGKFTAIYELSEKQANAVIELYKLINEQEKQIDNPNEAFKMMKRGGIYNKGNTRRR